MTANEINKMKSDQWCATEIESPYMRGRRLMLTYQKVEGERELSQLLIWKIVAVMGWLSFLAVVVVAGMR